jgi:hypothetical protein
MEMIEVTICGIKTQVPEWSFDFMRYMANHATNPQVAAHHYAISQGADPATFPTHSAYWKKLHKVAA